MKGGPKPLPRHCLLQDRYRARRIRKTRRCGPIGAGSGTIYLKDAANGTPERAVLQSPTVKYVDGWTRDGRFLIYSELDLRSGWSGLWALPDPLDAGERKPVSLSDGRFSESEGAASPDSRWLAYTSTESEGAEIYVRPFPPGDGRTGRVKVSPTGGIEPRWRADGKELYYRTAEGNLMAADVSSSPVFQPRLPHALFVAPSTLDTTGYRMTFHYDVSRDGQRFLFVASSSHNTGAPVTVVLNWESALRK